LVDHPQKALLELQDLHKHFLIRRSLLTKLLTRHRDLSVQAVSGVDLQVAKKQTIGLVGESGCGKSTLGRTIIRLHDPTSGRIFYDNQDVTTISGQGLNQYRRRIQMIFQNPYASLNPRKTVGDIIGIPLKNRGMRNLSERKEIIHDLIERVGLSKRHVNLYPHQFSGGQRQRIGIARALAMQPEFIVADEPVSALDVSVQAQIINLMEDLREQYDLTYLFISHDLSVIYYISDEVVVMYLGRIVETAYTEELFKHPLHPYTKALMSAIPVIDKKSRRKRILLEGTVSSSIDPPSGCRFHPRCFKMLGRVCIQEEPLMQEVSPDHWVACHLYNGG
jgi:oligopeptide/dipeptide ABC transporter ATP-binding protein